MNHTSFFSIFLLLFFAITNALGQTRIYHTSTELLKLETMLSQNGNQEAKIMLDRYYAAFDTYAYESELMHAAQNGLTLRQFDLTRNSYLYNSSLSGIQANQYNYTLWHLLKSILLPYW